MRMWYGLSGFQRREHLASKTLYVSIPWYYEAVKTFNVCLRCESGSVVAFENFSVYIYIQDYAITYT